MQVCARVGNVSFITSCHGGTARMERAPGVRVVLSLSWPSPLGQMCFGVVDHVGKLASNAAKTRCSLPDSQLLNSYRRHCERRIRRSSKSEGGSEAIQNASAAAVWIASSLSLLAMTVRDRTRHPRAAFCVRVMHRSRPSKVRGRRECRALDAPAVACAVVESTRVSHHRSTGTIRHSLHDGFTAYVRALPGVRA
jgi:hypothetical protein